MSQFGDIWNGVIEKLSKKYSKSIIDLWFASLTLHSLSDQKAVIICDMSYKYSIIKNKYLPEISDALGSVIGFAVEVILVDKTASPNEYSLYVGDEPSDSEEPVNLADRVTIEPAKRSDVSEDEQGSLSQTNQYNRYTFENFVVGESNKFTYGASVAVANDPACVASEDTLKYNPLFIYGPSGLGKTHLLYAIINHIKNTRPELKIVYVNGEKFTTELIDSITKKTTEQFRNKYREADVLLIDDIHFIAGRTSTQEEFFHTFNALHEANKQIILTSDRPVKEIELLEERLRTRFEWGLCADIQPPDVDLRSAIIQSKSESMKINLDDEVVKFLAENTKGSIRQIEGAIKRLAAHHTLTRQPITVESAKKQLEGILVSEKEPITNTIDRVFETVSKKLGIPVDEIKGTKRNREIAYARHISIYLIRKLTNLSLPNIGKVLKKDHSTIMSSLRTVEKQLGANTQTDADVNELLKELRS